MTIVSTYLPTFHKRFSLRTGKEAGSHTINEAKANISFQGANLWILLLAVLICSIGLNLNSTPVVIGAMLLSPLMGPIIGMGVGLAIYDTSMVWQGLRNLLAAFVLSILIAGLYFLLSPLQSATPEIIARSSPAIWDILIALAGGIVGAIALTRKEKGYTIIPGVAIATALMPPLCTAGYRLVQGDIITMFKALYLLFINTIYIAGATFLVARLLRLPKKEYPDTNTRNKVQWLVWSLVILTAIPGFRLTKNLLTHIIIQQQFTTFTQDIAQHYPVQVLQKSLNRETKTMNIWLIGSYLTNEEQDSITKNIRQHDNLKDYKLIIRQGVDANPELGEQIVQPLVTQALESQDSQTLSMIQQALKEYNAQTFQPEKVLKEAKVLEKSIESITFSYGTGEVSTTTTGELFTVSITTTQPLLLSKKQILEERIRTRIGQSESVIQWKEKNID